MRKRQKGGPATGAAPGQSAAITEAHVRTLALRDALLTGDPASEQTARSEFKLFYWEHRGEQILPSGEGHQRASKRQ